MSRPVAWLILLGLTLGLSASPRAQQPPAQQEKEEFRVRVAVELVTTPLVVQTPGGEFIYDLSRDDVALFDNGVPQRLSSFELAAQPLSLVILLDTSQRVAPLLDRVRKSGVLFTDLILGESGEASVITFDNQVTLRQEFTSDGDQIIQAIDKIAAGGNQTRLADALDLAVRLLMERPEERRRVIVAISEPADSGSDTPTGRPLRLAQLLGISVYTVSLSALEADLRRRPEETPVQRSPYPPGVFTRPGVPGQAQTPTTEAQQQYARADLLSAIIALVRGVGGVVGEDILEVYSQGSGGLHFGTFSRAALEQAIDYIGQDLHSQYMLSYRPSNREEGGFHRIEVRVNRPGVMVRTRPGYYVGPPL